MYRNYINSKFQNGVEYTYNKMLRKQTLEYVIAMKAKYISFPNIKKSIWEVIELLEQIIDESDPDTNATQIVHATQTAIAVLSSYLEFKTSEMKKDIPIQSLFSEGEWNHLPADIRNSYRGNLHEFYDHITNWAWFPLIGFIHDLGKVLVCKKFGKLPQWSVVGDTFPVGCRFTSKNIFYNKKFHRKNPDYEKYNKLGIYKENCGFNNVHMSYGHDEYLASVLEINKTSLPEEAIYIIRYHSFYAWHTPKNSYIRGYTYLADEHDWYMLPLLKVFQKADLYSKIDESPIDLKELKEIFDPVITKYIGTDKLIW